MLQPDLMMHHPLLFIVRQPGQAVAREEVLTFLAERVTKWCAPDDVIFPDARPVGATGKVLKGCH